MPTENENQSAQVSGVPLQPVVQPSDWPEDFPDENGSYLGKCFQCGNGFIGHKHRMTCKLCDEANKRKWDAMTEEEKAAARLKMAKAAAEIFGGLNPCHQGTTHLVRRTLDGVVRPLTRGELARRLKAGETCEVPSHVEAMTTIMLCHWLDCTNFTVEPSHNRGWSIYRPNPRVSGPTP